MSRETFSTFIGKLLEKTAETGHIIDFSEVPSWYYPRYFFSGSWNRVLDKAKAMEGNYVPASPIPYSDSYMYSPTRVTTLVEFLHDVQCVVLYGWDVVGLLNPTDKVKPFFTQLNAMISQAAIPVTSVEVMPEEMSMKIGERFTPTVAISPPDADNKTVAYTSSDAIKVGVSAAGEITAKALGDAKVTVTTEDGGYTSSILIHVVEG